MFSIEHLHVLRRAELEVIASFLPRTARILEIGAGSGEQARALADSGYDVVAVDVHESNYVSDRVFNVIEYDGHQLPFPDRAFDVVYSSNVLEHVHDLPALHAEIRRVLAATGYCVHVVPSAAWRFWSSVIAFPEMISAVARTLPQLWSAPGRRDRPAGARSPFKALARELALPFIPLPHGATGNAVTELWTFSRSRWARHFSSHGFVVEHAGPVGLFYTGNMYFGSHWPVETRRRAAAVLGSACNMFVVRPLAPAARPREARPGTTRLPRGAGQRPTAAITPMTGAQ